MLSPFHPLLLGGVDAELKPVFAAELLCGDLQGEGCDVRVLSLAHIPWQLKG